MDFDKLIKSLEVSAPEENANINNLIDFLTSFLSPVADANTALLFIHASLNNGDLLEDATCDRVIKLFTLQNLLLFKQNGENPEFKELLSSSLVFKPGKKTAVETIKVWVKKYASAPISSKTLRVFYKHAMSLEFVTELGPDGFAYLNSLFLIGLKQNKYIL